MQTEKFDYQKFIAKLVSFAPRQFENEKKTADFLVSFLEKNSVFYAIQEFETEIPLTKKVLLMADKKQIDCEGCSFVSGEIKSNDIIISSLLSSSICQDISNINYNPKCSGISLNNYYFAPAICVSREKIALVIKAKKIFGEVVVERKKFKSKNILVGNLKNPQTISFAHYDSIKKGAIDNASGVALLMKSLLEKPEILENSLFVFSGNEELSYDKPIYWGRGFRAFEKKYFSILNKTKKIIIVDCVGNAPVTVIADLAVAKLAFPILNLNKIGKKVEIVTADLDDLMQVYHSDLDDGKKIIKKYFDEAFFAFVKKIKTK